MWRMRPLAVALAALGCASMPEPERSPDGLVRVPSRKPGTLFAKPDHNIGDYDNFLVAEIGLAYAAGQKPLSAQDESRVHQMMADALSSNIRANAFEVVSEPGPCTLRIGFYLTGLEFYESAVQGSQKTFVHSYGAVTVVLELRDSLTNQPLVRFGQRRRLGSGEQEGRVEPDLDRIGRALRAMLADVGDSLQDVLPVTTAARAERGCEGRVGRAAKR